MAARHLGAMKNAIRSLQEYYEREVPVHETLTTAARLDPRFPHQSQYTSVLDSNIHHFKYVSQVPNKLVFFGKTNDNKDICIKFARSYSKEAHIKCAAMGIAPVLRGFDLVPGGWYMVTMDVVGEGYRCFDTASCGATLYEEMREKLAAFHQAGFVHGDVRDTNVMVRRDGKPEFMLVDFDWAGKIGEVRYPMNVNRGPDLMRPDGAYDGELILADHDMEMLAIMFERQ